MSAQCQHKLVRYECWKCRDEWKEPKPMSIDITSNNDALAAEVSALRHDIARHVQIAADQAQELEELRADLAVARALLREAISHVNCHAFSSTDRLAERIDAALAEGKK